MIDLYPRQRKALAQLRSGSILCGGVGSGKSRVALAYYFSHEQGKDLYIITTAKKRDSVEWEGELAAVQNVDISRMPVCIDSWNNIQKYTDVVDSFFIFDEQRVVGSGAWSKAFIKIAKRNHWLLLSATPGDNWSDYIPVFIANGFYKNRSEFMARHAIFSRYAKYPKIDRWVGTQRLIMLRREILVTMDYKSPAEHIVLKKDTGYLKGVYSRLLKTRWDADLDKPIESAGRLCYLLRECGATQLKLQYLDSIQASSRKVVVFYNYNYERDAIVNDPSFFDIAVAQWNGDVHDPVPDANDWLYLVQYSAGAEGWNCTSTNAMVFFSLNYSYKTMLQASGRIDRCNTPFETLYYWVFTNESPIEKRVCECLRQKKKFNESVYEKEVLGNVSTAG